MNTADKQWELLGKNDPYWGVSAREGMRAKNINDANKEAFFVSGETNVKDVFSIIEAETGITFKPNSSLDFGCGVARLTIPLAKRSDHVMGVDVSESMLSEARKNTERFGITNADYAIYTDELISSKKFDFIYTFIVLQHIPVKKGTEIVKNLLNALEEGGTAVIQLTFSNENLNKVRIFKRINVLMEKSSIANTFYKVFRKIRKGKEFSEPVIQMNYYDLNKIFKLLYDFKCVLFYNDFTNHDGVVGIRMFIRKQKQDK